MSKKEAATFVDLCISGEADAEDIDDFVSKWHGSDSTLEIYDYLGMTWDEYRLWVEKPHALRAILLSRVRHIPLVDALKFASGNAVAARAESPQEAEEILEWLRKTKRI